MTFRWDGSTNRLVLTVAVAALVALAGCSTLGIGGGGQDAVAQVPAGVDSVTHVDMAILGDSTTQALANAGSSEAAVAGSASNMSEAAEQFEDETGLDPAEAEEMVLFSTRGDGGGLITSSESAVIIHAGWDESTAVESFKNDSTATYTESTYSGKTIYAPETDENAFVSPDWFGVLNDGEYVTGDEAAVKDAIDVETGNEESFSGDLRQAFDGTRDGLVRFASTIPQDQIPDSSSGQVDVSKFQEINTVAGTYYTDSNSVGVEMTMHATGEDAAKDVADVTDGAISIGTGMTQNESVKESLRAIEVTRDGDSVNVAYEESVDALEALIAFYQRDALAA
jgi:hypothetical protein